MVDESSLTKRQRVLRALWFYPLVALVYLLQWVYECFWGIVAVAGIALLVHCEHRLAEQDRQFKDDCEKRGGFVLKSNDGNHCLDRSLQK